MHEDLKKLERVLMGLQVKGWRAEYKRPQANDFLLRTAISPVADIMQAETDNWLDFRLVLIPPVEPEKSEYDIWCEGKPIQEKCVNEENYRYATIMWHKRMPRRTE